MTPPAPLPSLIVHPLPGAIRRSAFAFRIARCAWTDAATLGEVVRAGRGHFTQPFAGAVAQ